MKKIKVEDIPSDVKRVIDEMELEEDSLTIPDEEQLEVLEDIWLKAGEMGEYFLWGSYFTILMKYFTQWFELSKFL